MAYVLDRFEGDTAVLQQLEGDAVLMLTRGALPEGAREGDVLVCQGGVWRMDSQRTDARRRSLQQRFFGLFEE